MIQADQLAKALVKREAHLRSKRGSEESLWQLLARYCVPRKASFTEKTTFGNVRDRQILDSTAPRSVELFASFLHSAMNNPTSRWFTVEAEGYEEGGPNRPPEQLAQLLANRRARIMTALTSSEANAYEALHEVYLDLAVFGTAVLYTEVNRADLGGVRIFHYHLADVVLDEGENGKIDTAIRSFCYKPRQALQRWPGRELGQSIDRANDAAKATADIKFLHACFPATDEDLVKLIPADKAPARDWPFYSVFVNATDNVTVAVSGYSSFPFACPRWYKSGSNSIYGRSPAMTVLGDILMVNRMAETVLRGAEKLVDPPLLVPDGGILSPVRLHPGGLTYAEAGAQLLPLIPPGASRIELGDALIEKRQEAIREGFFVPLFISPSSPVMTATQTLQIADEKNRATGPMVLRLQGELLTPFLSRVYEILENNRQFEPVPDDVGELRLKYKSPISASIRQTEALAIARVFEGLAPWYQIDEGIFDHIDMDKVPAVVIEGAGAPVDIMRPQSKVKNVRQERAQQKAAETAQASALQAVDASSKATTAQAAMLKAQR